MLIQLRCLTQNLKPFAVDMRLPYGDLLSSLSYQPPNRKVFLKIPFLKPGNSVSKKNYLILIRSRISY